MARCNKCGFKIGVFLGCYGHEEPVEKASPNRKPFLSNLDFDIIQSVLPRLKKYLDSFSPGDNRIMYLRISFSGRFFFFSEDSYTTGENIARWQQEDRDGKNAFWVSEIVTVAELQKEFLDG